MAQQVGAGQRRFGQARDRHRQHFAQAGQARVAEGRNDHRIDARAMFGRELRRGIGADQGLEAGLDVGDAERRRQHRRFSVPGEALRCASARISR